MVFYHYHHSSLSLHVRSFQVLFQAPYKEASSFREVTSGRLSQLWLYGFCGKLGVPSYTMMKTLTLWIRLRLFGNYWYIWLKVIMRVIRVRETQLIEKEGGFNEFGRLFVLCWL